MKRALQLILWVSMGLTWACGPPKGAMRTLEAPTRIEASPEAATVVFIRPSSFAPFHRHVILDREGRFLGDARPESYFAVQVPPGEHLFIAWSEGTPALRAFVEAGKIYYVEVGELFGFWTPRARLFAVGPDRPQWEALAEWLRKSQMLVPNARYGQDYIDGRREDVERVIEEGRAAYNDYDKEALLERTVWETDGVSAPR